MLAMPLYLRSISFSAKSQRCSYWVRVWTMPQRCSLSLRTTLKMEMPCQDRMSWRIRHMAMKVPVRPTPALQCTTGMLPSIMLLRNWSMRKWIFFLRFSLGIYPSGQSETWQCVTILVCEVSVFLSYNFFIFSDFFEVLSASVSSRTVIQYSFSTSLELTASFSGKQRSHLILVFSMKLQSMKIEFTLYSYTIRQKLQKVTVRGPWVAIAFFPYRSIRFAFMQFQTFYLYQMGPKVAREGSQVINEEFRLRGNCSGFLQSLLT